MRRRRYGERRIVVGRMVAGWSAARTGAVDAVAPSPVYGRLDDQP
ncbi:hypothetical protein [Streptomyces viridochromogenes]|uniref:Uncharacterized protein n=1 Tax=Streptomyces viridochromogenes Tue57 TaxID=1160705 RepID=L8PQ84_STRVR|nr:hypothetical protein [Streptomyces viridochromogenes]ELS57587.1 hypothetical protein STVIR_1438 [Streptomyces viridochromogenes Tue57]